ncbi:MAG: hemerythrin domain-containing protein [Bacteroidales bacterium]|nr:hemerythrin domain-containing protein [Bacteroidales bacterium]
MPQLFTPRMKMADLIGANHSLILMLPRLNIPLGFGDSSVREVCSKCGVPEDFVLLISNVYSFDDYLPTVEQLAETDMSPLVPYLMASHHYYIDERLPHIGRHLQNVADRVGEKYGSVLTRFFADYQAEVRDHFLCEETEVFPFLQNPGTIPTRFIDSHDGLIDKLGDLTQTVYKYLPGNILPDESIELVFDILQLSSDLEKHALIEEKVLLPYAQHLAAKVRASASGTNHGRRATRKGGTNGR